MIAMIVKPIVAAGLQRRFVANGRIAIFSDTDSIVALQTILQRRPDVIAMDPTFAATTRGATLIAAVRSNANTAQADLRVLMIEERDEFARLLQEPTRSPEEALTSVSRPLDWCGTRRAPRYPIATEAPAAVNGEVSQLVNLSATGVQLISAGRLRPNQSFRLTLQDDEGEEARLNAIVMWCALQGSAAGPRYRAGAQFVEADHPMVGMYCNRYGKGPDRLFAVPEGAVCHAP
jgi:PilZ domain